MRAEKSSVVELIQDWVSQSPYVIIVDFTGMTVPHFDEFRNRLAATNAQLHVVKNTYLKIALDLAKLPNMADKLKGQTAIIFGQTDMASAAKVLKNFVAEFEKPEIRCGLLGQDMVSKDDIIAIADLPSREVLLAKLLGLINAPATKLATLINTPGTQLAQVIKAKAEKE